MQYVFQAQDVVKVALDEFVRLGALPPGKYEVSFKAPSTIIFYALTDQVKSQ